MNQKRYQQYCGMAYALDIVGERWTLLILRELVAGPRRFKDLLMGLPEISTNLLTERLKHLEEHGVVRRRVLPPPAGSAVYEMTAIGHGLKSMMIELGKWGSQFLPPTPEEDVVLHLGSYALTPQTFFRPDQAQGITETYELHIGNEVQQVRIENGEIQVRQGESRQATAIFTTDMSTYLDLLTRQLHPDEALARNLIQVEGDVGALHRFLNLCGMPVEQ